MAHTAIALVPCAFAAMPFAKFKSKCTLSFASTKAPYQRKIAMPLQERCTKPVHNFPFIAENVSIATQKSSASTQC